MELLAGFLMGAVVVGIGPFSRWSRRRAERNRPTALAQIRGAEWPDWETGEFRSDERRAS